MSGCSRSSDVRLRSFIELLLAAGAAKIIDAAVIFRRMPAGCRVDGHPADWIRYLGDLSCLVCNFTPTACLIAPPLQNDLREYTNRNLFGAYSADVEPSRRFHLFQ